MEKIFFKDLGPVKFDEAWKIQQEFFNENLQLKNSLNFEKSPETKNHLLFCEHPHVYTLGKSGSATNLLVGREFLESKGAEFYRIDRGGDITYHGPGQIVGYPIIDLEKFQIGVKDYIFRIEETIIRLLSGYGIQGERHTGATGVWLDTDKPGKTRKICAIGVKASRYITMHGFAFNVSTNLDYFGYINPCGFKDKAVTSLEKELGKKPEIGEVKQRLLKSFSEVFEAEIITAWR